MSRLSQIAQAEKLAGVRFDASVATADASNPSLRNAQCISDADAQFIANKLAAMTDEQREAYYARINNVRHNA